MQEHVDAADWSALLTTFEKLTRHVDKLFPSPTHVSRFLRRALRSVASAVESAYSDKEQRKSLSTTSSKALSALRQRISKYSKINNLDLTAESSGDDSDVSEEYNDASNVDTASDKKDKNFLFYAPSSEVTYEMVDEKLKDIIAGRGKKSTDRATVVKHLSYMATLAKCPAQEVEILLHIISAQFDMVGSMSTHMQVPTWKSCVTNLLRLVSLLRENGHISLVRSDDLVARPEKEDLLAGAPVTLAGSLCAFVERLDDEYTKSLQNIDPHTKEYLSRLQDECFLLILLNEVLAQYSVEDAQDRVERMKLSLRLLGHLHYKSVDTYLSLKLFAESKLAEVSEKERDSVSKDLLPRECCNIDEYTKVNHDLLFMDAYTWFPAGFAFPQSSLQNIIQSTTMWVYKFGDERAKVRAILYDTFHKSICCSYAVAKEQLLMSHLQEVIHHADVDTQVLFNRCMAQMAVNAFECGAFNDAQACLSDIMTSGRPRELLAQGLSVSRHAADRNYDQEKLERRRQVPFHTHISIELLEAIYLVSGMLTDTHVCANAVRPSRNINRGLIRVLEGFEKQTFNGPPEGVRDTVLCAARQLMDGDWSSASSFITNMSCWSLLPGSETSRSATVHRVINILKLEALRTYISQRSAHYESVCMKTLSEMFDTDLSIVQATVNVLLASGLVGCCDGPTTSFATQVYQPTSLQHSAITYSESLAMLLDVNERAFGVRSDAGILFVTEEEDLGRSRHRTGKYEDDSKPGLSRHVKGTRHARYTHSGLDPTHAAKNRKHNQRTLKV